jgi:putative two-component system response regulator
MGHTVNIESRPAAEAGDVAHAAGAMAVKDVRPAATVLVVDDEEAVAAFYVRVLTAHGYAVRVTDDGPSALADVKDHPPDVVILDVGLPTMSGVEVCRHLKRETATRLLPVILITGGSDELHRIGGLEAGADDFLAKPVDTPGLLARLRSLVRMKRYTDDLDSAASIIMMLAVMIEGRDGYTHGHCHRLANYATAFGRRLGLDGDDLQSLYRGGFLHDIGMLAIPDYVLRKEGPLSDEEYRVVTSHTVIGDGLCANLRSLTSVRPIVRHHHEKCDGSGYPDGLRGDAIPVLAQIMGIVDAYDAITTRRPYHDAQPSESAFAILASQVERGWRRRDLVDEFTSMMRSAPFAV